MKALLEITKWEGNAANQPNHTYIIKKDFAFGYIKFGTTEIIKFSKPLFFTRSWRKFQDVTSKIDLTSF